MTAIPEGPGWWQASDGRWYPPELHPSIQQAGNPGPSTAPAWSRRSPSAAPGGLRSRGLDGWRRWTNPRRLFVICLLAVAIIGGGVFVVTHRTAPQAPTGSSGAGVPGAATAASEIGVQARDLGTGYSLASDTAAGSLDSSGAWPCTPLSGTPGIAGATSPTYSGGPNGPDMSSRVVIYSSAGDAEKTLNGITASSFGARCSEPTAHTQGQRPGAIGPGGSACTPAVGGSSVSKLSYTGPQAAVAGYRFTGVEHCSPAGATASVYTDILDEVNGTVFIQGMFRSDSSPVPSSLERWVMAAMAGRAQQLVLNPTAPSTTTSSTPAPTSSVATMVPPCGEFMSCGTQAVPVQPSLSIDVVDSPSDGQVLAVRQGGTVTITVPSDFALQAAPGFRLDSQGPGNGGVIYVFTAQSPPGGEVDFHSTGNPITGEGAIAEDIGIAP
jgi:hypothetical protein